MRSDYKKQLAWLAGVSREGIGLGPGVDEDRARSLVQRLCSGTTSAPRHYAVLWQGEHLSLVYWPGQKASRNDFVPGHVDLVRHEIADRNARRFKRTVHACGTSPTRQSREDVASGRLWSLGRLTTFAIGHLVVRAMAHDKAYPETVAEEAQKRDAEDAAQRARVEAEEKARADRVAKVAEARSLAVGLGMVPSGLHVDYYIEQTKRLAALVLDLLPLGSVS